MFVDVHSDDLDECGNKPQDILLEGDYVGQGSGMATYSILGCAARKGTKAGCGGNITAIVPDGCHTVYFQATDSDSYAVPIMADVVELNLCSTSNSTKFLVDKLGEM